jgi:hypothetical protein
MLQWSLLVWLTYFLAILMLQWSLLVWLTYFMVIAVEIETAASIFVKIQTAPSGPSYLERSCAAPSVPVEIQLATGVALPATTGTWGRQSAVANVALLRQPSLGLSDVPRPSSSHIYSFCSRLPSNQPAIA